MSARGPYVLVQEAGITNYFVQYFPDEIEARKQLPATFCWVLFKQDEASAELAELASGGVGFAHPSIRRYAMKRMKEGHGSLAASERSAELHESLLDQGASASDKPHADGASDAAATSGAPSSTWSAAPTSAVLSRPTTTTYTIHPPSLVGSEPLPSERWGSINLHSPPGVHTRSSNASTANDGSSIGASTGASANASSAPGYPTWENWRFRRTIAYWVAMMFLEGSILFTIGGSFEFFAEYVSESERPPSFSRATVLAPYLVGSITFTLGAWAGIEELLRLPRSTPSQRLRRPPIFCVAKRRHWQRIREVTSWEPIVAYPSYFVGALLFNINTVASYVAHEPLDEKLYVWTPAVLGSVCFVVGGACECSRNLDMLRRLDVCRAAVVQSVLDFAGGLLFLLAAVAGLVGIAEPASHWLVDLSYLAGSVAFLGASTAGLWMWKDDQHGLALVPEINFADDDARAAPEEYAVHQEQLAQYGCGKSSAAQIPWLLMYLVNASASVIDVALSLQPGELHKEGITHSVLTAALNFALSHGVLALGSVLHHVPTAAPHSWLVRFMRLVLLCYTGNSWLNVIQRVVELE